MNGQPPVHRLPQQVSQGRLGVLAAARIRQVLSDQIAEAQPLVQLPHQDQDAVGGDPRSVEIDLQLYPCGERVPPIRWTHLGLM